MAITVTEWTGGVPIAGQTYVAPAGFKFDAACKRFEASGMEFMHWNRKFWVPDLQPAYPSEETIAEILSKAAPIKSDGGPSTYYDFLPDWVTLNDAMEYLAEHRWGKYALHLKDANKACFRFGAKEGAGPEYDAKKLVYSGLRLLVMIIGKTEVHSFLQKLIADPQFQPKR